MLAGHFHLSHDYHDSLSHVGQTTFVSTGVIGGCTGDVFKLLSSKLSLCHDTYCTQRCCLLLRTPLGKPQ